MFPETVKLVIEIEEEALGMVLKNSGHNGTVLELLPRAPETRVRS